MIVKHEFQTKNETGTEVTQTAFFSDFKKVNGVIIPNKLEVLHDGKAYVTAEFSTVEMKEKLDADTFKKP